jgi:flagellar biosynthesis/type III secretory pathway chaperone
MDLDARRRLEDVLDREIEAANSLAATLAAERSALTGDVPGTIQEKAAAKVQILKALEQLESERRSLWAAAPAGGLAAAVAERWRTLMKLIAGCRTENEINGHIIRVRQHQVGQLMDIVRGGPAITYGPRGKTFAKALRALARA